MPQVHAFHDDESRKLCCSETETSRGKCFLLLFGCEHCCLSLYVTGIMDIYTYCFTVGRIAMCRI